MTDQNSKDIERLDEHLGLPPGTTEATLFGLGDRSLIGEKLRPLGIILDKRGNVPKAQRPLWQELMQSLGIGREWWMDPGYYDVPDQEIPKLEL